MFWVSLSDKTSREKRNVSILVSSLPPSKSKNDCSERTAEYGGIACDIAYIGIGSADAGESTPDGDVVDQAEGGNAVT